MTTEKWSWTCIAFRRQNSRNWILLRYRCGRMSSLQLQSAVSALSRCHLSSVEVSIARVSDISASFQTTLISGSYFTIHSRIIKQYAVMPGGPFARHSNSTRCTSPRSIFPGTVDYDKRPVSQEVYGVQLREFCWRKAMRVLDHFSVIEACCLQYDDTVNICATLSDSLTNVSVIEPPGPWSEILENWVVSDSRTLRTPKVIKLGDNALMVASKISTPNKREVTETDLYLLGKNIKCFSKHKISV